MLSTHFKCTFYYFKGYFNNKFNIKKAVARFYNRLLFFINYVFFSSFRVTFKVLDASNVTSHPFYIVILEFSLENDRIYFYFTRLYRFAPE